MASIGKRSWTHLCFLAISIVLISKEATTRDVQPSQHLNSRKSYDRHPLLSLLDNNNSQLEVLELHPRQRRDRKRDHNRYDQANQRHHDYRQHKNRLDYDHHRSHHHHLSSLYDKLAPYVNEKSLPVLKNLLYNRKDEKSRHNKHHESRHRHQNRHYLRQSSNENREDDRQGTYEKREDDRQSTYENRDDDEKQSTYENKVNNHRSKHRENRHKSHKNRHSTYENIDDEETTYEYREDRHRPRQSKYKDITYENRDDKESTYENREDRHRPRQPKHRDSTYEIKDDIESTYENREDRYRSRHDTRQSKHENRDDDRLRSQQRKKQVKYHSLAHRHEKNNRDRRQEVKVRKPYRYEHNKKHRDTNKAISHTVYPGKNRGRYNKKSSVQDLKRKPKRDVRSKRYNNLRAGMEELDKRDQKYGNRLKSLKERLSKHLQNLDESPVKSLLRAADDLDCAAQLECIKQCVDGKGKKEPEEKKECSDACEDNIDCDEKGEDEYEDLCNESGHDSCGGVGGTGSTKGEILLLDNEDGGGC